MKNTKKGFTLVELLVVIAIVAILATVAIIGYTSFMKKAALSNDQAFITQANTTLQAAAVPNGFKTAGEAITALNNNGFQGKYNTYSSGFHYAYSLEKNKLYLVDDKNSVVYPEEDVELSSLWGLYTDNRTSYISGVTKYVAMTNITNSEHFDVFASGNYTIDLNGYFIGVDGTHDNVTANNGIIISGVATGEGVDTGYELLTLSNSTSSTTLNSYLVENATGEFVIENKIFTQKLNPHFTGKDVKFVNCIFYNDATISVADIGDTNNKITFENCQFINISDGWAITAYRSISLVDCTFTGLNSRGALQVHQQKSAGVGEVNIEVVIDGCTFDGVNGEYPIVRFVAGDRVVKSVEVSNCSFTGLNKATGIIGFRNDELDVTGTTWTFTDNTFNNIPDDKYVLVDSALNEQFKNSAK